MAESQALLTALVSERRELDALGLGGSSSSGDHGGVGSIKGVQLVMKNRARFSQNPEAKWVALNERIKELLQWQEGMIWSLELLFQRWPWGYQKQIKRWGFMLAKLHAELNKPSPSLAVVKGLTAQMVKVVAQAALDHGQYDMAMTYWP